MKVGILGAAGFVGRALHAACVAAPTVREVRALARSDFDLAKPDNWGDKLAGLDCVVNAAARIDGDTFEIFAANALFAHDFAQCLNRLGIKKLVNLSTGAVYGECREPTTPEQPCRPVGDYPVSKYLGERVLSQTYGGYLNHLRIYYPYGAGQTLPRLVPRLIENVCLGRRVTCDVRGGPLLSMSHVEDIASVILEHFVLKKAVGAIHNIASPHQVSIRDILAEVQRLTGITPNLSQVDEVVTDVLSEPYEPWEWRPFSLESCVPSCPAAVGDGP